METRLKVKGSYKSTAQGSRKYMVQLLDGEDTVDVLLFDMDGATVFTQPGYPQTTEGARLQAQDHWF